ncbi:recombining binding protein suppressor of hairless-like protein isoform X1 [Phyllopteryx taeniolatus]|uniref:recombining binding protein suppressor of hairless-like protein isoform X1 n=1 Tax=Phyllopteryx taeniolatus TaxID=161469 RepID=UPI002AD3D8B1|nr:recombining binding protein suppressor of hairless-like protein isoform X1 [Phyllopteryx taeniolatus]
MDIAAMMDELTDAMEDGQREVSLHHSACYQNEPVTHLLDGGHAAWDRRAEPACQSLAPRGGALGDQSVVILHAKVAQKSYGNEKRFFCPPPCVYIGGNIWRLMHDLLQASVCGGGGAVRGYMCVDSAALTHSDAYKLNFETLPDTAGMLACAKSLFISDQDKRKHFRLLLRLFLEVGSSRQEVGSFHSRPIKVISKPSQKRQTMKNADLCISASSRVALFNRLRSQTVSTRYLAVEGGAFVASARQWTAFAITLLEDHRAEHQGDFVLSEGFVCYGSVVQLVCTETGLALPPMVIRKVNKQHVVSCVDEPVSQLHKCALEMRESPRAFLAVANDAVVLHRAASSEREAGRALLNDGSCWTVIGVEVVEFAFCRGDAASVRTPVTPFPDVAGLELNGGGHVATLELHGDNFGPHLKVCFGASEADTMFKSAKSLVCVVPDVCVLRCGCRGHSGQGGRCHSGAVTVPISLRRRCDGVLYRTAFSFTYTPELRQPQRRPARPPDADGARQDDALLESIHHEFARSNFHLFTQP